VLDLHCPSSPLELLDEVQRPDSVEVRVHQVPPPDVERLLARIPAAEIGASVLWNRLAARHYPGAEQIWLIAESSGEAVGFLPVITRRHHGFERLESSLDGVCGGPQVPLDLPSPFRDQVFAALCRSLVGLVGRRRVVAAFSLSPSSFTRFRAPLLPAPWLGVETRAAVVPCADGLAAVDRRLERIRRSERDRALRRGCRIQVETDAAGLSEWYPLYAARAARWAQIPVPLGFMQDLLREAPERVVFGTVRRDGELLGGHFGIISAERLVSWQGGVRPGLPAGLFTTVLLYWLDITTACERGLAAVDFGGCAGRESLWDFKRRFGAEAEIRHQWHARTRLGQLLAGVAARIRS
jgi:hypothetical protein